MVALSQIAICNRALARIKAAQIASIDEDSLSARECRRFYPEAVSDMLEGDHDWSFANRRVRLALLSVNDRPQEWLYAYAAPSGMAGSGAIRLLPDLTALGLSLPVPLPGEPYAETWAFPPGYFDAPYEIEGTTIYSNVQNATLEYGLADIAGIDIPQRAATALTLDLASRLAVPVKGDSERELTLGKVAEIAWQRAIADDKNRQPQTWGSYISEAMLARRGYVPEVF